MGNAQWTSLKVVILIAFQADAWIVRESFVDRDIWAILKRKDRPWVSYVARKTLYFWNSCPMSLCYCALHTPPCPSTTRFIRSSAMLFSLKWSKVKSLSRIRLFVIPLTVAHQAPLSIGLSCKNTGVSCYSLLQGIFLIQGSDLVSCPGRRILYHWVTREAHTASIQDWLTLKHLLSKPLSYVGGKTWMGGRCGTPFSWQPFAHFLPSVYHLPATEAQKPTPFTILSAFVKLGQPRAETELSTRR